jgi:exonuclease III
MRAYNGNTAIHRTTVYPHKGLKDHLHQHEHDLLTLITYNSRTLVPKPNIIHSILHTTPSPPDIVILTETHPTDNTVEQAKTMWRSKQFTLRSEKKGKRASAASGVAINLRSRMPSAKIISHDPMGNHLAILLPLANGTKILLIGVYAPQRKDPTGRSILAANLLRLLEMAKDHQYSVILTGDWNDVQDPELDTNRPPQLTDQDPWFLEVLQNPWHIELHDPWRVHNPEMRQYTYFHRTSPLEDRKDFTLVSTDLLPCVTWTTNALWPLHPTERDHTALGLALDLSVLQERQIWAHTQIPARTEYLPHTASEWHEYKTNILARKLDKCKRPPRESVDNLINLAMEQSEITNVAITHDLINLPPHPFQHPLTKKRVHFIHRCNEALHPDFPERTPEAKRRILMDLKPLLPPVQIRQREQLIRRVSQARHYLPEIWKSSLPAIRREQARLLKKSEDHLRQVASDRARTRIQKQARDHPAQLLRRIKTMSPPPTSVAITAQGNCLTTIPELSQEAQIHLRKVMSPPLDQSPLALPDTPESQLTPEQQANRLAFVQVLQEHAPTLSTTQRQQVSGVMRPADELEIRNILRKLKRNSYTPGIPMVLLKELPDKALTPLKKIINAILVDPSAMTPQELLAHLTLLPKEDPLNLAKVRPITMSGALYKIIAHLISTRIMNILETDSFLLESNVGFTPHGETHHLIIALQAIFDMHHARKDGHKPHLHALLVDLSQAYDRVPWYALLQTLDHLGFPPQLSQWLHYVLQHSPIHLKFPQGVDPNPMSFKPNRGVRQGCPLSPILFAIFNDTLLRWIAKQSTLECLENIPTSLGYADDMGFLSTGPPATIHNQISILNKWENLTDQLMNSIKTKILTTATTEPWEILNPRDSNPTPIQKVNTFKYLGVVVHATPTPTAREEAIRHAHKRFQGATNRLLKLKSLPLPTATKSAIISSAIQSMVPYGAYAIAPSKFPVHKLQTKINNILKGGKHHRHMCNAVMQHPQVGENTPNVEHELPFQVIADLHRIFNTPNFTQKILGKYLHQFQVDHAWPHHPLDPATLHLKPDPQWQHSLADIWRQWMTQSPGAVRPAFITIHPYLNPGGWTNFFSSTRFDYQTAKTNRNPWIIPEDLRQILAVRGIYNFAQLQAYPPTRLQPYLSEVNLHAYRMHIANQEIRHQVPTDPPLRNPWHEPHILPIGPWARDTYTAGDGAASEHHMAAAWLAATARQYNSRQVPRNQTATQPVFGYINSTWSETYALEGALITSVHNRLHTTLSNFTEPVDTHVQDNESTVQTFNKYLACPPRDEGHFVSHQQARPVWRRIMQADHLLTHLKVGWRKGHSNNQDINAADLLTKESMHHYPLEKAEEHFPDLQPYVEGMDLFSLILTFPSQPHLPVAHPCLPNPESLKHLRPVLSTGETPSAWITLRHDGTRQQLHSLWKHLMLNKVGLEQPTYRFMTTSVNLKMAQSGLLTTQIGYWVTMRKPPTPDETLPPIASPITMGERTLILHLRQGLWVVHDTIYPTDEPSQSTPAFRMCAHCNQIATLHHILCVCTHPLMQQHRQFLLDYMKFIKYDHPDLPMAPTCQAEHRFNPDTPTNLANTRFRLSQAPPRTLVTRRNPACLHARLGLRTTSISIPKEYYQLNIATMHTTCRLVHQWMTLLEAQNPPPKCAKHLFIEDNKPPVVQHRPPLPSLQNPPRQNLLRSGQRNVCIQPDCTSLAPKNKDRCCKHQPNSERSRPRKSRQSTWRTVQPRHRAHRTPCPTSGFILVSGGFGPLTETWEEPFTEHTDPVPEPLAITDITQIHTPIPRPPKRLRSPEPDSLAMRRWRFRHPDAPMDPLLDTTCRIEPNTTHSLTTTAGTQVWTLPHNRPTKRPATVHPLESIKKRAFSAKEHDRALQPRGREHDKLAHSPTVNACFNMCLNPEPTSPNMTDSDWAGEASRVTTCPLMNPSHNRKRRLSEGPWAPRKSPSREQCSPTPEGEGSAPTSGCLLSVALGGDPPPGVTPVDTERGSFPAME